MDSLARVYRKHWAKLFRYRKTNRGCSNPLLIDLSADYWKQSTKLFVVGQQTNTWYNRHVISNRPTSAESLVSIYRDCFRLGYGYNPIFWQAVRQLEVTLGIAPHAVAWSNLNRFDLRGIRPSSEEENEMGTLFDDLLRAEIRLARPDVVIFFSGPSFDDHIRRVWPSSRFSAIPPRSANSCVTSATQTYQPILSGPTIPDSSGPVVFGVPCCPLYADD